MSGFAKISAAIVTVFVLCFLVFSYLTFFQIKKNILEETSAAMLQAEAMIEAKLDASEIAHVLSKSPHLRIETFFGRLSSPQPSMPPDASIWQRIVAGELQSIIVPVSENNHLIIHPNEDAELLQNLSFFWLVLSLFVLTLGLLLLTINIAIKHQLKPLSQLANAIKALRMGSPISETESDGLHEVKLVINQFNQLQQRLLKREQEVIALDKKLALLQEKERTFLAQELHDNVGQLLTCAKVHSFILTQPLPAEAINENAEKVQSYCNQISKAIRELTEHLHPLALDKVSLGEALQRLFSQQQSLANETKWRVQLALEYYSANHERDIHIYRLVQEAVNNIVKHANAKNVTASIVAENNQLSISITDDGCGFKDTGKKGIGMSSMQSRARCLGGNLTINSQSDKGTDLTFTLDLDYAEEIAA